MSWSGQRSPGAGVCRPQENHFTVRPLTPATVASSTHHAHGGRSSSSTRLVGGAKPPLVLDDHARQLHEHHHTMEVVANPGGNRELARRRGIVHIRR